MEFSCQEGDGVRYEHDHGESGTRQGKGFRPEEYMPVLSQNRPRCDSRWGVAPVVRIIIVEFLVTKVGWLQSAMWETISFWEWNHQDLEKAYRRCCCGVPKHFHSAYPESTSSVIPLRLSPESRWLFEYLLSDLPKLPNASFSSVSRMYANLVNLLNTSRLIIPSVPLHPPPGSTWTWPIVWRPLIWSSHPIMFIPLQGVRKPDQLLFDEFWTDHPLHPSPARTWPCSIL